MKKRGFTLIELLVVITIIAILATVILMNLAAGRERARASNVLQTLRSVQSTGISCLDQGAPLIVPDNTVTPTNKVCDRSSISVWPDLVTYGGWQYITSAGTATSVPTDTSLYGSVGFNGGSGYGSNFVYGASKTLDDGSVWYVLCDISKCVKSGF